MNLVPIEKETPEEKYPPGTVVISPYKEQLIGVRYSKVQYVDLTKEIRTVGIVKPDERRTYHVHVKVSGWIEKLYVNYRGAMVKKGQPLFTLYSPELLSSQEEYLIALNTWEKLKDSPVPGVREDARRLLEAARERLLLWDITPGQIRALERKKQPFVKVPIYSKYTGYVIWKNVIEGMFINAGTHIYEIADLSRVWVMADIYESETPFVSLGDEAVITSSYDPSLKLTGTVDYIYPYLDEKTRTQKVRLTIVNDDELTLRPEMYVNVILKIPLGQRLAVPVDAVMRTGKRNIVFVRAKEGTLVPREIRVGPEVGDYLIVLDGLEEGDEIVTSANFLIDSESKLKLAIESMGGEKGAHKTRGQ